TCSFGGASRGRSAGRSGSPGRVDSAGRLDGAEESDRSMLMLRSSLAAAADVGGLHQVGGGVLFAAGFERLHLAPPDALALLQRVLARLCAEEFLHGRGKGLFGLLQFLLRLLQAQLCGLLLFAEPVDMRLALFERQRERNPRRRRLQHAQALAGALAAQFHDLLLDALAGLPAFAHRALLLHDHQARLPGAVRAQLQQCLQGIARARAGAHANSFLSVSEDSANGTSSPEDCCNSLRIGPMRSMAKSASGSLPRLYSPSCSNSSMSWCLASALRNWPAARRCAWSTTRGMVRLRLVST